MTYSRPSLCLSLVVLTGVLCTIPGSQTAAGDDTDAYEIALEEWHRQRIDGLTSETGWLSLIGLFWLEEGVNTVGSDPEGDIVLPSSKSPFRAGTLFLEDGQVRLQASEDAGINHQGAPATNLELAVDTSGSPTMLDLGDLQFYVLERSGLYGLRVRDRNHPARFDFPGLEIFSIDPRWRITGRLETHDPPRTVPIPNVLGQVNEQESPGTVVFEIDGQSYRLDSLRGPDGTLYLIFGDQTSGRETYGGGRFLYSESVADDGSVILDFNKAYNPPCAFTDYATCPLPPRQNKLSVRIEAGEKSFGRHH